MRSMEWKQLIGKIIIHGSICLWWWTSHQSSAHKGLRLFRFCIVSWWDTWEHPIKHSVGTKIRAVQKFTGIQNLGQTWCETMELDWNILAGFNALQLSQELRWGTREYHRKDHLRVDVQRHLMVIKRQQDRCESNDRLFSIFARRFGTGQWSFLGLGSEKKWEKMMLTFSENGHPVFRAASPSSRGKLKSRGGGKLSIHYCAGLETIQTVCRTITSVNQLSLYGAVSEMSEAYESFDDGTGKPVEGGQSSSSFVLSVIKTEVLLDCDDRAHKDLLLQKKPRTNSKVITTRQIK